MPYITSIERMGIERGLQQGRQEGREEGRQEDEATLLRRLLTQRFGPLPTWVEERLTQASVQELERWADRILEAQQLDEVFVVE